MVIPVTSAAAAVVTRNEFLSVLLIESLLAESPRC
jgi:hypothetical protein